MKKAETKISKKAFLLSTKKIICFIVISIIVLSYALPVYALEAEVPAIEGDTPIPEKPLQEADSSTPEKQSPDKEIEIQEKKESQSNLVITGYKVYRNSEQDIRAITRGQTVTMSVSLKNTGIKTREISSAKDLIITKPVDSFRFHGAPEVRITSSPDEDLAFTISFDNLSYSGVGNLFQFIVSYSTLSIPYDSNEIKVLECVEYVKKESTAKEEVKGEAIAPLLQIYRANPKKAVQAKDIFNAKITLKNLSSDTTMENLQINFETSDALVIQNQSLSHKISSLAKGKSYDIDLTLEAAPEISFGAQYITANIKYDFIHEGERQRETVTEKVIIPTTPSEKKEDKTISMATPNVVISRYDFGEQVAVGDTFDLEIEFKNTSPSLSVENMVMLLETGEALSIEGSSNSFYIANLPAGAIQTTKVQVLSLPKEAAAGNKIDVSFKYEFVDNEERKQVTVSEKLSIPVFQPDRFQVSPPILPENIFANQELVISLPYVNKGRTEVYNVEAIYEGNIDTLAGHQNLGNFEAGKSGTIDFILTPNEAGTTECKVKVVYEDVKMKAKELEFPIKINVSEPPQEEPDDDFGFVPADTPAPNKPLIYIVLGVLLGTVPLIIIIKKIKTKKAATAKHLQNIFPAAEEDNDNETP